MTEKTVLMGYAATVEAIIFASDKPVRERELRHHIPDEQDMAEIIEVIQQRFDASCGIELRQVGDGWAFRTRAEIAERLNQHKQVERPLSRAALEVLAIIAYHQPITRAEIEEIRGISLSKGTMDILLELTWIKPRGRRRTPGRPLTWGTSPAFLDHFGLDDITDLPGLDELKSAGLLRKGQILGALMDSPATDQDDDADEEGDDLLDDQLMEEAMVEAGLSVNSDEEGADA
ncbi:MAG: SMC-Scp complex subunit ScpB [Candidatus Puniceispirillaceae bacterium]|jgi:segregation and condensation protein B